MLVVRSVGYSRQLLYECCIEHLATDTIKYLADAI